MSRTHSRRSEVLATAAVAAAALSWALLLAAAAGALPPTSALALALPLALGLLAVVALGSARPELQLLGPAVLRGPLGGDRVALTFDDGPDPASTPALLDALEAADAQATFFILGERLAAHPELARRMAERHELAVHGWGHHPWLSIRSHRHGAAELRRTAALIEELTGQVPRWYRPAFGVTSPRVFAASALADLTLVWCSLRTGDGGRIDSATLRARCARAVDGDILLLHEGPRPAATTLPDILSDLAARGLRPVTLGELLAARP